MTVLDLFSGIGGFSLGFERAGMKTIAFCEIKKNNRDWLKKNWPDIQCYEDVRNVTLDQLTKDKIESIDVICGGFPCQDLSIAGRKIGITGKRSSLYREMLRIISECLPRYAVFENVTNLIVGNSGRWFAQFLYDLATIRYDAEWHCISASSLGANHHRDRVWIVAYPKGNTKQNSIFAGFPKEFFCKSQPGRTAWSPAPGTHWATPKPSFCAVDDGVSRWVGEVSGYGNSIVPQIAELIGNVIMKNCRGTGIA